MDDEGTIVPVPPAVGLTVGLLGAEYPKGLPYDDRLAANTRLEEIERRILAIEEMIWPTGR